MQMPIREQTPNREQCNDHKKGMGISETSEAWVTPTTYIFLPKMFPAYTSIHVYFLSTCAGCAYASCYVHPYSLFTHFLCLLPHCWYYNHCDNAFLGIWRILLITSFTMFFNYTIFAMNKWVLWLVG